MECTGQIYSVTKELTTGKLLLTFSVNEPSAFHQLDALREHEKLSITAKEWKAKRSLDANALLWAVLTEIAAVIHSDKDSVYEEMLQKYGNLYKDDEGYTVITIKASENVRKLPGHWRFYKSNDTFSSYLMIQGTSTYDTGQMARFLNRVIEEATELNIQPPTSEEMARALALWEKQYEKHHAKE